ncbi:hypothetical protein NEMBOFW57_005716 [Staphylotrichum longicolle]|uniref:Uncharacterized protein n=1 Tax=Staphylotrichum longicolle TaxID=669026 RepID=A0AAD4EXJ2_9PEZI|nr:hypothetical protein NEMBOFW57_005716 [Staphylotrichum longicolle]
MGGKDLCLSVLVKEQHEHAGTYALPKLLQLLGINNSELVAKAEFRSLEIIALELLLHLKRQQLIRLDLRREHVAEIRVGK